MPLCRLQGLDQNRSAYWRRRADLCEKIGPAFAYIEVAVRQVMAQTPRASSIAASNVATETNAWARVLPSCFTVTPIVTGSSFSATNGSTGTDPSSPCLTHLNPQCDWTPILPIVLP